MAAKIDFEPVAVLFAFIPKAMSALTGVMPTAGSAYVLSTRYKRTHRADHQAIGLPNKGY
jgi:hypothetical protein